MISSSRRARRLIVRHRMRGRELVGVGLLAQLLDLFQLGLAQLKESALKLRIKHVSSSAGNRPRANSQYIVWWVDVDQLHTVVGQIGLRDPKTNSLTGLAGQLVGLEP